MVKGTCCLDVGHLGPRPHDPGPFANPCRPRGGHGGTGRGRQALPSASWRGQRENETGVLPKRYCKYLKNLQVRQGKIKVPVVIFHQKNSQSCMLLLSRYLISIFFLLECRVLRLWLCAEISRSLLSHDNKCCPITVHKFIEWVQLPRV